VAPRLDDLDVTVQRPSQAVSIRTWVERARQSRTFGVGAHHDFELTWVDEGTVHYRVGRRDHTVTPGVVILLPAGHEHATCVGPSARACSVHLSAELIAGVAEVLGPGLARQPLDAGLVPAPERVLRLGSLLLEEGSAGGAGSTLAADGLAEALVVHVLRGTTQQRTRPSCRDPRIDRVLQAIEAAGGAHLDVEGLARTAGMSRYHFSRVFREVIGASPYQHLLGVRLARAAELLRGGQATVTEAALAAGFTDFGRFASHFHRRFGCLPSQMTAARSARRMAQTA